MKKILGLVLNAIVGLSFGFVGLAWAQSFNMPPPGGVAVIGCIYNSSPPTNTSGLPAFVQCDVNGQLKTTGGGGGGGGGTSSNFGAAFPAAGTAVGFTDGINMQPGTIKPASTTPSATDPAIVVSLSPNSAGLLSPGQATMGSSLPVVIASNQATFPVEMQDSSGNSVTRQSNASSAVGTGSGNLQTIGYGYGFNGTSWDQLQVDANKYLKVTIAANAQTNDPCQTAAKSYGTISQTTSTQVLAGTTAKKTYLCSFVVNGSDAENISIVEGTGTVCATNIYSLLGGTTANAGMNFTAGSGVAQGNGGYTIAFGSGDANATAANICVLQSGSGRVAGNFSYVQL